jgi:AmiR/NasT family two-component response regulator
MKGKGEIRVLIAEDDFLVGQMIEGLLHQIGFTVAGHALDGQQAVDMACSIRPDVVLMDIKMPVMDGIEATRRIQELCPIPVVMLTAHESRELVEQASAAGVAAYLVKPPNVREIERAVTIALARFDDLVTLRRLNAELEAALAQVKTLRGLLPICAACKKIRDDKGYWHQVEVYIRDHSEAEFSHGICPDCARRLYPDYIDRIKED